MDEGDGSGDEGGGGDGGDDGGGGSGNSMRVSSFDVLSVVRYLILCFYNLIVAGVWSGKCSQNDHG